MKRAFTLMEVNLAMLVMAGGILSIVSLYSLGFRESRQSREDVASAAFAEAVISPLVMAISATNLTWSNFKQIGNYPSGGWGDYVDQSTGIVRSGVNSKGQSAFTQAMGKYSACAKSGTKVSYNFPSASQNAAGLQCGLVVLHEEYSPIVKIGFRAPKKDEELFAAPLYCTEVRFQGVMDENPGNTN